MSDDNRPQRMRGLSGRFARVVLVIALLTAATAGAVAYQIAQRHALDKGRMTIDALISVVEATASVGAFANDQDLLHEVIAGLSRHPWVGSVIVRSKDGRLMAGEPPSGTLDADQVLVMRALLSPLDQREQLATLEVYARMAQLHDDAHTEAARFAIAIVLLTAVLSLVLYLAASRWLSQPIARLARSLDGMVPVSEERLPTQPQHADDEIGSLADGVNTLLDETQAALERERELRAAVEAMELQYRQVFDATRVGIFVLDTEGRLINGNPTVMRVIGAPVQQIQQLHGEDFLRHVFANPARASAMLTEAISRGETVAADLELIHRDGVARWVHCLISVQSRVDIDVNTAGEQAVLEGVMYDVTDRKHHELALRQRPDQDPLTGLKNRASSETAIDRFIADAAMRGGDVTLLYIDLDGFKRVNDELGHGAGDEVLQHCARRMQSALRRSTDLVGRLGSDEFVIALPSAGAGDGAASAVAAEVIDRLCTPIVLDDGRLAQIGASIGMASYPRHGLTRKELVIAADATLYEIKRHGRNAFAMSADQRQAEPAEAG